MTTLKLLKHLNDVYYKAIVETDNLSFWDYRDYLIERDIHLGICYYLNIVMGVRYPTNYYWIKRNLMYNKSFICTQSYYGREYLIHRYNVINKEYRLRRKYWIFAKLFK